MDVVFSISYALSYVPFPVGVVKGRGFGNTTTCSVQAFFTQLGSLSYVYSMCLTIYFVLTIRYNVRKQVIATYVEPVMHFAIWSFGIVSSIMNVTGTYGNPGIPTCWVATVPQYCDIFPEVFGECIRGEGWVDFGLWTMVLPNFIETLVILVCLGMVIWTVWQKRRASSRFVFGRTSALSARPSSRPQSGNSNNGSSQDHGNNSSNNNNNNATMTPMERQAKQVIVQCLLYAFNFLNSNLWQNYMGWCMWKIHDRRDPFDRYPLLVLNMIFYPLQGFCNFLIFVRPRYLQWRA